MFNHQDDEEEIYRNINYRFKDRDLLLRALTRQSAINEGRQTKNLKNFQQLEFLGDKILDLVIGDLLLEKYPDATEGKLTIETAKYVNNKGPLAIIARRLKLNKFMIIGRGEEIHNNVRDNDKALSDAMEALLGALWLDSNRDYFFLKKFISTHWKWVGLSLEPLRLVDLELIIVNFWRVPLSEGIQQLKACFERPVSQEIINAFLAGTAFQYEKEVLNLVLSQKPDQSAVNNALINAILMDCNTEIAILLKHGANANFVYPPENYKEWEYAGMEVYDQYAGRTISALCMAATSCSLENIELLLHFGADPNWNQGISTKTAYFLRESEYPKFYGTHSQVNTYSNGFLLFGFINNRKQKIVEKFNKKFTALHEIVNCRYGIEDVEQKIILLIQYKANPNVVDYEGNTSLHIAANADTHNIYDLLIELGADPNIKNNKGETPEQIKQQQEYRSSSDDEFPFFPFNLNNIKR